MSKNSTQYVKTKNNEIVKVVKEFNAHYYTWWVREMDSVEKRHIEDLKRKPKYILVNTQTGAEWPVTTYGQSVVEDCKNVYGPASWQNECKDRLLDDVSNGKSIEEAHEVVRNGGFSYATVTDADIEEAHEDYIAKQNRETAKAVKEFEVKLTQNQCETIAMSMHAYAEKHVNDVNFMRNYKRRQNRLVKMFEMENLEKMKKEKEAAEKAASELKAAEEFKNELADFSENELECLYDDCNFVKMELEAGYFIDKAIAVCTAIDDEKIIEDICEAMDYVFSGKVREKIEKAVKEAKTVYTVRFFATGKADEEGNIIEEYDCDDCDYHCLSCNEVKGLKGALETADLVLEFYTQVYYVPGYVEVVDDEDNEYFYEEF